MHSSSIFWECYENANEKKKKPSFFLFSQRISEERQEFLGGSFGSHWPLQHAGWRHSPMVARTCSLLQLCLQPLLLQKRAPCLPCLTHHGGQRWIFFSKLLGMFYVKTAQTGVHIKWFIDNILPLQLLELTEVIFQKLLMEDGIPRKPLGGSNFLMKCS